MPSNKSIFLPFSLYFVDFLKLHTIQKEAYLKQRVQSYGKLLNFISLTKLLVWIYYTNYTCRDWVWTLFLWDEWIQAQQARYNKFVESG